MIKLQAIKMRLNGFKRIQLPDTRGVLNKTNNYKWVRQNADNSITTILPSGTRIDKFNYSKFVTKSNGDLIACFKDYKDSLTIKKGFSLIKNPFENFDSGKVFLKTWKEFIPKSNLEKQAQEKQKAIEALNQKRLALIEHFTNKFERKVIVGENGAKTKIISDKETGKTVSWWRRNEKKEVTQGHISYSLGGLIKEVTIETPTKIIIRTKAPNCPIVGVNALEVNTLTIDKTNGIVERNSKIIPWEKLR